MKVQMTHIVHVNKEVPLLRFKEFEGIWTREKFKGLVKINQGLQIPISERYTEEVDNSYFYITNEFLKAKSDKKYYIKNPNKSVLCDVDDILMTRTGNTGMVVTNVKGAFHNNFFKIAYPSTIDKDFLFYFLNLTNTQNTIKRLAGTSTIPDLNHSDFYRIDFPITTLPEQQKIASFLSAVDEKLQQLTKKKDLLEKYKKGVMQKIFSQELRFKDDNGNKYPDWEEKKLGEVDIYISDGNYGELYPKASEMKQSGIPFVRANNIKNLRLVWNDMRYIDAELHSVLTSGHLKTDDILVTTRGDIGMVAIVSEDFNGANINAQICLLRVGQELNAYFLLQFLGSVNGKKQFKQLQTGSALKQLPKGNLRKIKLKKPFLEEQQKIANFLSSLDSKIDSVSIQIKNTKAFKKGLLQQMFV